MMHPADPDTRRTQRRGFSAVEIIAVATIISILALVLLPILSGRVEDAKLAACRDELKQLATCLTMVYADTGNYVRLQDLDNGQDLRQPAQSPTTEVPIGFFNSRGEFSAMLPAQRSAFGQLWRGRYTSFHSYQTLQQIQSFRPNIISATTGPIWWSGANNEAGDFYPLDPWGSPYMFFPPSNDGTTSGTFHDPILYSLGPDGLPGSNRAGATSDYLRRNSILGTGDDIEWRF